MSCPKCWLRRSRWRSYALLAGLAGLLLSGPASVAQPTQPGVPVQAVQSGQPAADSAISLAPADTAPAAQRLTPEQAMELANQGELQPSVPVPTQPGADSPVSQSADGPGPKSAAGAGESSTWKWVLGIVLGLVMGYFLARIMGTKTKVMVHTEDTDAPTRRHRHQRGAGSNPASREEKEISKSLNQEFMKGPMRAPNANVPAPPPREQPAPPRRPPAASTPKVNQPKAPKPARPMPDTPTPAPAKPSLADTPALPPSITELIDESAAPAASSPAAAPIPPAAPGGPVQFYGPAPDVPSIEHRKLSPNPLPQMPLLVKLANPDATRAEFSFSPQADQSRIIGNGVRELKEFFAFELPPTEQFTTIKNLTPGKLEKREDTWHVVQKASIALS